MKTRLISLIILAVITTALVLTGCSNDSEPNFGEHGAKVYEPSLSAMSEEAIRIKIDELYDKLFKDALLNEDKTISVTDMFYICTAELQALQNELILRQLEALNSPEPDKQPIQIHAKSGAKELGHKQDLRGFSKNTLKGNE